MLLIFSPYYGKIWACRLSFFKTLLIFKVNHFWGFYLLEDYLRHTCYKFHASVSHKAGRFVLGIVLCLQYLQVLGLPNTYFKYGYFPNTIQYNIFLKKKVGEDRNNCRKEEEENVKWMRRMRKDRFFRKCRKKSGEKEEDEVWKMRMRKDRFSLRYNPSDLILGQ